LGALLLLTMLFFPTGIVVSIAQKWRFRSRQRAIVADAEPPKGKQTGGIP
jgi:hypothetical protein